MSYGLEPHGTIWLVHGPLGDGMHEQEGGRGVPGVGGMWVGPGRAIPVPRSHPSRTPYLVYSGLRTLPTAK